MHVWGGHSCPPLLIQNSHSTPHSQPRHPPDRGPNKCRQAATLQYCRRVPAQPRSVLPLAASNRGRGPIRDCLPDECSPAHWQRIRESLSMHVEPEVAPATRRLRQKSSAPARVGRTLLSRSWLEPAFRSRNVLACVSWSAASLPARSHNC